LILSVGVEKVLGNMEALKGFIQIPVKDRARLIGDSPAHNVMINGEPGRLDKRGRIWSPYLKGKFVAGERVQVTRIDDGFRVDQVEAKAPTTIQVMRSKAYFGAQGICIYNDSILDVDGIEKDSIDLIVTSPPYDVDIKYEDYDDSIPYDKYLEFTRRWLARCYEFAKDDGRFCLNIPLDKNKGGQQSVCADITTIAKEVGWRYHATIIWNEQNISRRTAWGSWLSASAPFVIAPVEVIVVLYKKKWKKTSGSGKSDITRDEFLEWTNAVWNFSGESKNKIGHPSPFPVELPRRCIKLFSFVEDMVLDPFLGSGTTLIACLQTKRKGIGVDIDKKYCELAVKRLKEYGIEQKKLIV
jgi:site-specific DNA-methyltransferase (adenine-specific)